MRVLFVSSGNLSGNKPSTIVVNQAQSLIKQGIEITYFTIIGKGLLGYIGNVRKLKKILSENTFDVVHAHFGFCGFVAYFAKRNEKVVVSLMGSDLLEELNESYLGRIKDRTLIFFVKLFSRYFIDFTIVKSEGMSLKLFRNTRYAIIPNGVDFSVFFPVEKNLARKALKLELEKKIVLFPANKERKEKNFALAQKAISLINNENLILLPIHGLTQAELNLYYNASDVLLMTSIYEGSPNVIKENLACDRVIVSTDVGDVRKNFVDVDGCFITSYNAKDIAEKICLALSIKESNGRMKIAHLNSNLIAIKLQEIYKNLCAE